MSRQIAVQARVWICWTLFNQIHRMELSHAQSYLIFCFVIELIGARWCATNLVKFSFFETISKMHSVHYLTTFQLWLVNHSSQANSTTVKHGSRTVMTSKIEINLKPLFSHDFDVCGRFVMKNFERRRKKLSPRLQAIHRLNIPLWGANRYRLVGSKRKILRLPR